MLEVLHTRKQRVYTHKKGHIQLEQIHAMYAYCLASQGKKASQTAITDKNSA